eukprot:TRINITY_DN3973_c0_g1_i1.p1 TRINITY_DN3973_c0_g1~~TRINITY_DN3973_c0_g1_i1.p1  ORF type:complete len:440 (-),score=80.36 TRINITY_DN3973_c0_g1_i1:37-1356(-)
MLAFPKLSTGCFPVFTACWVRRTIFDCKSSSLSKAYCTGSQHTQKNSALPMSLNLGIDLGAASLDGSFNLKVYLAGAKDVYPHVDQISSKVEPQVQGTPDDFLAEKANEIEKYQYQMKNKVRKCPACSKAVAFTLASCNGCGHDLREVEITYTNNIFTSFCYGIQKGPFPFVISMRSMASDIIVFDDLLSLTPCHVNVIPTNTYCADWRYLLLKPKQGLELLNSMYASAWKVVKEQFLENKSWGAKVLKNYDALTIEELESHLCVGCNYPPSQYQLHLQFMLPPFLPYHYRLYLDGLHFTNERFFPIEYLRKVLELNEAYEVNDDTPIEDIIAHFRTRGVDYNAIYKACYDRYGASHQKLSNWKIEDFNHLVINDTLFDIQQEEGENIKIVPTTGTTKPNDLINGDKMVLQNYGRPYVGGKPSGGYYDQAKTEPLTRFA